MIGNWPEELFVESGAFYEKVLESYEEQTPAEVEFLLSRLEADEVGPGSRILDLCCGIGRHSLALAEEGYDIVGFDLAPRFVERAENDAAERGLQDRTRFVRGDMRKVADVLEDESFDAVINLFSSFGFYDEKANQSVLEQCLDLTRPDGIFIIDTLNRDWLMRNFQRQGIMGYEDVMVVEQRSFDHEQGRSKSRWRLMEKTDEATWRVEGEVDVAIRVYTLNELIREFGDAGWLHVETFGSLTGDRFELGSRRLTCVFKAP